MIDKIMDDPSSTWRVNANTPKRESKDEIITKSMEDTLRESREKLREKRET